MRPRIGPDYAPMIYEDESTRNNLKLSSKPESARQLAHARTSLGESCGQCIRGINQKVEYCGSVSNLSDYKLIDDAMQRNSGETVPKGPNPVF